MWRVTIIAAVPVLVALVVGVLRTADELSAASGLRTTTTLLEVRAQVARAADLLRDERAVATVHVAGGRADDWKTVVPVFDRSSAAADGALQAAKNVAGLSPTTSDALTQIRNGLVDLAPLRRAVIQQSGLTADEARVQYSTLIGLLDTLDRALLRQVRAPESADLVDALTATVTVNEQLAQQHDILAAAIRTGRLGATDTTLATAADTRITSDYQTYLIALGGQRAATFGTFLEDAPNGTRAAQLSAILGTPPGGPIAVPAQAWDQAYNGSRAAASGASERLSQELLASSRSAAGRASLAAGVGSALLLLVLVAAVAVAVVFGRSLVRGLRMLQHTALDVASRRLPDVVEDMRAGKVPDTAIERVPLDTVEEVGQVARAFDAVHSQAVHLAGEQAALQANVSAMFVNLSRRSQALVQRQLHLIEGLEETEQDADQLASLFRLDHLATRMRRNSENLLVLAGTDLATRYAPAVAMEDVLRAAVSEIEKYERVVIGSVPRVEVVGRAASDLSRLLAELLDNAVTFSPPEESVALGATRRSDGSVVVEVVDRGVGMVPEEFRDANERLRGVGQIDLTTTRRMGLFVVGRLSVRHGVTVRLVPGEGRGVTAVVTVPAALAADNPKDPGAAARRQGDRPGPGGPARTPGGRDGPGDPADLPEPGPRRYVLPGPRRAPDQVPVPAAGRPAAGPTRSPSPPPAPAVVGAAPPPPWAAGPPGADRTGDPARLDLRAPVAVDDLFVPMVAPQPFVPQPFVPPEPAPADASALLAPAAPSTAPAAGAPTPSAVDDTGSAWFTTDRSGRLDWQSYPDFRKLGRPPSLDADEAVRADGSPAVSATTPAGLPKRRPAANLLPGSLPPSAPSPSSVPRNRMPRGPLARPPVREQTGPARPTSHRRPE